MEKIQIISSSANAEELQSLAKALVSNGLSARAAKAKERSLQQQSGFRFSAGDKLTINAGYATPASITVNEKTTQFLAFPAKVLHANGGEESLVVSLAQTVNPSISLKEAKEGATFTASELRYRFGKVAVDYRDTEVEVTEGGKKVKQVVSLPFLPKDVKVDITVGTVYANDWKDGKLVGTRTRENYGYCAE